MPMPSTREFIDKKTIIVGEVNTGKTAFLNEILEGFLEGGHRDLFVIDMAPETTRGVGGKMKLAKKNSIGYLTAEIVAPRLMGGSQEEIEALAKQNALLIDHVFSRYLRKPGKVLFINDISIYLQAGDLDKLLLLLNSTPTVIMNGYFGKSLGGGELGKQEREKMKTLQETCDRVISLPPV